MDKKIIKAAEELSIQAIRKAGQLARERFDKIISTHEKDQIGDVVTEVDFLAEEIILNEIANVFPDHKIHSEEQGDNGKESEWTWLVDPLDGTNNYAIGLPIFATSITLLNNNEPVLGVIYEPLVDHMVKEAGGIVIDFEGMPFNGRNEEPYLIACHSHHRDYYMNLVKEGLRSL